MIYKLDNTEMLIATQIYNVFQRAYKIEAQLIDTDDFPPLKRSVDNIQHSLTGFYGLFDHEILTGVIEIEVENQHLNINSLVVDPDFFKQGIVGRLIRYVLDTSNVTTAYVETAVVNVPAINLYNKYGFVEFKRFTPPHGIEKVAMSMIHSRQKVDFK